MPLELIVDHDVDRRSLPTEVRRKLGRVAGRMAKAAARTAMLEDFEVVLRLVTDLTIHELNRTYRGKDKPTDVLAFAQQEGPGRHIHPELLGDIVISVDTARRQATRGLYTELVHLASHGLCHLLGYDHRDDAEEAEMNARALALRRAASRAGRPRAA